MKLMGLSSAQVGCLTAGIDAQSAALEFEWASSAAEKVETFSTTKALKATLDTITTNDGELNVARAALTAAQAQALADVVAARA